MLIPFSFKLHHRCAFLNRQVLGTRLRAMNAGKFQQLRSLVLVDCNLSELVLDSLDCLEILDVRRNRLTSLPPSIGRCRRLETLRVASNELRHLPGRELGGLNKLTALDCSFNKLKRFPIYLVQCIELTILEVNQRSSSSTFTIRITTNPGPIYTCSIINTR